MNYLLDTCVLSEARKKQPNPGLAAWLDSVDELRLAISMLTLGEIQQGIAQLSDSKRKRELQSWLDQQLIARFEGRILPAELETALEWGLIVNKRAGQARQTGSPAPVIDAMLAATAITHNHVFVTRNTADFDRFNLKIINPWT